MSHNKHHDHCQHEMAFCIPCDAPYCKRCDWEWPVCRLSHWPSYNPSYPWVTTTTTPLNLGSVTVSSHTNHTSEVSA